MKKKLSSLITMLTFLVINFTRIPLFVVTFFVVYVCRLLNNMGAYEPMAFLAIFFAYIFIEKTIIIHTSSEVVENIKIFINIIL